MDRVLVSCFQSFFLCLLIPDTPELNRNQHYLANRLQCNPLIPAMDNSNSNSNIHTSQRKKKHRGRGRNRTITGSATIIANDQERNIPGQRDELSGRAGAGRGRGQGRRRGRSSAQVDQSQWRVLEKPYREFLVKSGIAINAIAFNALSFEQKISAREAYFKEKTAVSNDIMPILLEMAVKNMEVGWDRISENRTSRESITAKQDSIRFYGLHGTNHCQILGNGTKHVRNAHIWPYNNKANLPLVSLEEGDINNPRNVLRLHKDIEYHFDRFFLTLVPSGAEYIMKILDPNIVDFRISDTSLTLGDVDGKPLLIPSSQQENRPWRRLLATHSIFAHRKARSNNQLPEDQLTAAEVSANEMMDFSLDDEAQARMKLLFRQ